MNDNQNQVPNLFSQVDGSKSQGKDKQPKRETHSTKRPNQNVRPTSKDAHRVNTKKGVYLTNEMKMLKVLQKMKKGSRRMIATKAGIEINSCTEPTKSLIENGYAIEHKPRQVCKVSGYAAHYLHLTEKGASVKF